ncbi:MAG: SlyX family protein [Bdellovibrionales bacterium]|nr:SlyX family protein [Bdellovibrionales bacterium]
MEERLTELETKISYQEQTIEDLNQVVIELRWKLDKLEGQCKQLSEQLDKTKIKDKSLEVPPPHY